MANNCDVFLKIDGIKGESSDDSFKDQVEIDSWHVSASNPAGITSATGGAGTGRVSHNGLHFTAKQSAATAHLFDKVCKGDHIDTATLTCRKAGGSQQVFYTITMSTVYITDHAVSGSVGSPDNVDSFTMHYGTIKHEYFAQKDDGSTVSTGAKGHDAQKNKST
jgi:type VI secretion system secreted protein Hcp